MRLCERLKVVQEKGAYTSFFSSPRFSHSRSARLTFTGAAVSQDLINLLTASRKCRFYCRAFAPVAGNRRSTSFPRSDEKGVEELHIVSPCYLGSRQLQARAVFNYDD